MYAWHMSLSAISGVTKKSAHVADNSTNVAQNSQCFIPLEMTLEH